LQDGGFERQQDTNILADSYHKHQEVCEAEYFWATRREFGCCCRWRRTPYNQARVTLCEAMMATPSGTTTQFQGQKDIAASPSNGQLLRP